MEQVFAPGDRQAREAQGGGYVPAAPGCSTAWAASPFHPREEAGLKGVRFQMSWTPKLYPHLEVPCLLGQTAGSPRIPSKSWEPDTNEGK